MQQIDVSELIASFCEQSGKVKEFLTSLLEVVKDGRVPTQEALSDLDTSVNDLQVRYDAVFSLAKDSIPSDELPDEGSSLNLLVEALEKNRSKIVQQQLEIATETLSRFISIKSLIESYAIALAPYQSAAADLLSQLTEDSVDEALPKTEAPALFLDAVSAENIHSPSGIELMKRVQQFFPEMEISFGIIGKQYYLDSGSPVHDIQDERDNPVEPHSEEMIPDEPPADELIPVEALSNGVSPEVQAADNPVPPELQGSDGLSITSVASGDDAENKHPDKTEPSITEYGSNGVYPILNKVKIGPANASSFKKEIDKLARVCPEIRVILPLLTNVGALTKPGICAMGLYVDSFNGKKETIDRVYTAVDILTEKGYLAQFQIADDLVLYCLSGYSSACLHKDSIRQAKGFLKLSVGNVKVYATDAIQEKDFLTIYLCNDVLLGYLNHQMRTLPPNKYGKIVQSIRWRSDHYQIAFYDDDTIQQAFLCVLMPHIGDTYRLDGTGIDAKYLIISKDDAIACLAFNNNCKKVVVVDREKGVRSCDPQISLSEQIEVENYSERVCDESSSLGGSSTESASVEVSAVSVPLDTEPEIVVETAVTINSSSDSQQCVPTAASPQIETASKAIREPLSIETNTLSEALPHTTPDLAEKDIDEDQILTPEQLLVLGRTPSEREFCGTIHKMLAETDVDTLTTSIVNAVLLAKGAGLVSNYTVCKQFSAQLRLATGLMTNDCNYSSECLATTFGNTELDVPALALSAYMYALLTPSVMYDYGLSAQSEQFLSDYDLYFGELVAFKALYNLLLGVRKVKASGFTPAVIALLGDEAERERFMRSLRCEATANLTVNTPRTRMKALPVMYNNEFGIGSDLYLCMETISEGKTDSDSLEVLETVLSDYATVADGEYTLDEDRIEERLNHSWDEANSRSKFKLEYDARDQALRQYRQRLSVVVKWVGHLKNRSGNKQEIERLKALRKDILNSISEIRLDHTWEQTKDAGVLSWLLTHMEKYLKGSASNIAVYSDLLRTGVFSLSEEGVPEIDVSLGNLKYYEVWRNALRHIVAPRKTVDEVVSEILGETVDGDSGLKDNLRQLSLLGTAFNLDDEVFSVSEAQTKEATVSANVRTDRFKDTLELAYTYYQINETEKETLAGIMNQYKASFYSIGDFAAWRRFLEALEMQIGEYAAGRKKWLRSRLDAKLAETPASSLLLEAERLLEQDSNFAVTEEYLNRYETGERELDSTVLFDIDYFSDFLSPSVFTPLYNLCKDKKGQALKSFGWNYLENHLPKDWTNRLIADSRALVSNWPSRRETAGSSQVQSLLKGLGVDATGAKKVVGSKEEMWQLTVNPTAKSLADYLHPIAAFGTQMKSPLQVIFLYGSRTAQQLVDTVTSMNLGTMSIVFIDQFFDAASRRHIGEIFHTQKTGQNPFLLVDQVLVLYLAMHQETERLPALLKCTLPYATYQPFVRDGGSTADEMFCGRTQELATIIDPNGACVVYGGRQLGKTALLERAESRCSKPDNKAFAVYSTIIRQRTEAEVVETLLTDIKRKTDGKICLKSCNTLREMCSQLGSLFRSGEIVSMHLLIDEVDDFFGAIADEAYKPIQPLVDLKRETKNNFKFVIAGLHNVCRAKNATRENGIFGQLGTPLCIKPLSPTDALQLLSRPLRYLGFQIDRYPHLETILTNTNYYPGILQFFGYILVETLTGQYSKYYRAADGNPPFTLQDEQLGAVMNSSDLNKSIKDKFRWSLELDPRYFMIARCITMLYHLFEDDRISGSWRGFSVEDVMDVAAQYNIHCLENVSKSEYIILMDEMVEMGILGKPDDSVYAYRLRRNSFVDIIGENPDTLEADIINNNTED